MWEYKKQLEFPVHISKPNLRYAKILITQIGGYAGELGACIRYFMQAPTMPDLVGQNLLIEIATEEMAHIEILVAMIKGLTKGATYEDYKKAGVEDIYAERAKGLYPQDATGNPFSALTLASSGDVITDLTEDLAAEEKARAVYEHLMDLTDDPEILGPLSFLRQREIVHYQRFAEALKHYQEK
ncbi:MAG: manganese catalase family protein [Acholeplasmatales bacterium]|nr:manganese catalase family protein [Acholeplasmatales bacterium]